MTAHDKDAAMRDQVNSVQQVRHQIVDAILIIGGLVGFITYIVSLMTSYEFGWQLEDFGFALIFICALSIAAFHKRVPYRFKTATVIFALYGVGLLNMLGWGLIGSGAVWFVLMVLVTMILHNTRLGLLSYMLVVLTVAIIAFLVRVNWLVFDVDFEAYALSNTAWLARMLTIILVSALMVASVGRIIAVLRQQLEQYRQHSDELAERTQELTSEMTKRELAEHKLAEVIDRLQDLDHLKDNFIDSVSHELRTPIANIQLYHQLLAMKPEKTGEYLVTLKKETERLSYIVEQMLHASGDSYDMTLTTMVDIDLRDLVNHLFQEHIDGFAARQITLNLPDSEGDFVILASPEHVIRALSNLIDNAVKYTHPNGQITVNMVEEEISQDHHLLGVAIQNTGDCPLENERQIIFERFVRGESSLNMGVAGAGLGLAIVRQIAEQYRGRVDLVCDEAQSTLTFTFWLPSIIPLSEFLADDTATPLSST